MTRQRYNAKESLNRIVRSLQGSPLPSDTPDTVTGEVLSEDAALSDLAELLAGSLPNATATLPSSVSVSFTNLDPRYGGIYTWTGTVHMQGITSTYTKITGSFHASMVGSSGITLQPTQDRILVNDYGIYLVAWQATILGSSAVTYAIEPYVNSVAMHDAVGSANPSASGSTTSLSGLGFIYISGSAVPVDLRVASGQTAWFKFQAGQLTVHKVDTA